MDKFDQNPIVLIDDDKDDIELATYAIRFLKYENEIITFDSSQNVVSGLIDQGIDPFVIICDVNLPGRNGIELRKTLYENEGLRLKTIPFIFWSTSPTYAQVFEAYENWSQGIFEKPASHEELIDLLDTILTYWSKCGQPKKRLY
ncbi:MAG: response regulator [Chitinophagaceae bacterium]|nr:MAG: response regulator [Chitinophagaceae bacterium]